MIAFINLLEPSAGAGGDLAELFEPHSEWNSIKLTSQIALKHLTVLISAFKCTAIYNKARPPDHATSRNS